MQSDLVSYDRTILYLPALLFSLATLKSIIQSKEKKDKDNNENICLKAIIFNIIFDSSNF